LIMLGVWRKSGYQPIVQIILAKGGRREGAEPPPDPTPSEDWPV